MHDHAQLCCLLAKSSRLLRLTENVGDLGCSLEAHVPVAAVEKQRRLAIDSLMHRLTAAGWHPVAQESPLGIVEGAGLSLWPPGYNPELAAGQGCSPVDCPPGGVGWPVRGGRLIGELCVGVGKTVADLMRVWTNRAPTLRAIAGVN